MKKLSISQRIMVLGLALGISSGLQAMEHPRSDAQNANKEEIFQAVDKCSLELLDAALASGASVHARNHGGDTPLHRAARFPSTWAYADELYPEIVTRLITAGADVNALNSEQETPLQIIAAIDHPTCFHVEFLDRLIAGRADVTVRNSMFETPLHVASSRGNIRIVERLLNAGADVDAQDRDGNTPLGRALQNGHIDTARFLLNKNASLHLKNARHQNAFDIMLDATEIVGTGDFIVIKIEKKPVSRADYASIVRNFLDHAIAFDTHNARYLNIFRTLFTHERDHALLALYSNNYAIANLNELFTHAIRITGINRPPAFNTWVCLGAS